MTEIDDHNYHTRSCSHCGFIFLKTKKKCPNCNHFSYRHPMYEDPVVLKRNEEIVAILGRKDSGITLQSVADIYHLSRERVRKIYKSTKGIPYTFLAAQKRELIAKKRKIKKEVELNQVRFICAACTAPVTKKYGGNSHKYCQNCRDIYKIDYRDPITIFECATCQKQYHPLRNWPYTTRKNTAFYCSRQCYFDAHRFPSRLIKRLTDSDK